MHLLRRRRSLIKIIEEGSNEARMSANRRLKIILVFNSKRNLLLISTRTLKLKILKKGKETKELKLFQKQRKNF
jgi:hypothetical protein